MTSSQTSLDSVLQYLKDDDKEYLPSNDDGDSDDVDFDEEGVAEGKDSVLAQKSEDKEDMDTIGQSANHNYYLRSLTKPNSFPMTSMPLPVPPCPAKRVGGI